MSFSSSRIAAGFSLDDVSRQFHVSPDEVRKWEEGTAKPPENVARSLAVMETFASQNSTEAMLVCPSDEAHSAPHRRRRMKEGSANTSSGSLIKSKKRVADHGEVFTPEWLVEKMLNLVKGETERIDSRFLEPACGSGNFLVPILQRKLAAVESKYGKSDFEKRQYALQALACCYGIELLADNIKECRANMLEVFAEYLGLSEADDLYRAASYVLSLNLIHGDAMKMKDASGGPIMVVEWSYLEKGKFNRRDFRLEVLMQASGFGERWAAPESEQQVTLFNATQPAFHDRGRDPIFIPIRSYPPMTVRQLAALDSEPAT